jgi:hypothetical protein
MEVMQINKHAVGWNISTKAVNSDNVELLDDQYKYPECMYTYSFKQELFPSFWAYVLFMLFVFIYVPVCGVQYLSKTVGVL